MVMRCPLHPCTRGGQISATSSLHRTMRVDTGLHDTLVAWLVVPHHGLAASQAYPATVYGDMGSYKRTLFGMAHIAVAAIWHRTVLFVDQGVATSYKWV